MTYVFRIRVTCGRDSTLNIETPFVDLPTPGGGQVVQLRSWKDGAAIKDSEILVLVGHGLASEDEATIAGERYGRVLMRTLAHVRVGADFGARAAKSWITQYGLAWLEGQAGQRVLNDEHGTMVYAAEPSPKFASMSATAVRGAPQDRFERTFRRGLETDVPMDDKERVAFELFNASFFQPSPDSRFLLRVMAVEALIQPQPQSAAASRHVESLIAATQAEPSLVHDERQSLVGRLGWLLQESINRAGKNLAETRLAGRTYLDHLPARFFSDCYEVRSRMVHGVLPFPTREVVDRLSAGLELFVSDLLSGPLINVE